MSRKCAYLMETADKASIRLTSRPCDGSDMNTSSLSPLHWAITSMVLIEMDTSIHYGCHAWNPYISDTERCNSSASTMSLPVLNTSTSISCKDWDITLETLHQNLFLLTMSKVTCHQHQPIYFTYSLINNFKNSAPATKYGCAHTI